MNRRLKKYEPKVTSMKNEKIGLWIFGINGNIGSSLVALSHISKSDSSIFGNCLSYDDQFSKLKIVDFSKITIGGLDLQKGSQKEKFSQLVSENVIPSKYNQILDSLDESKLFLRSLDVHFKKSSDLSQIKNHKEIIRLTSRMIQEFRAINKLDKVICVNLISTEELYHQPGHFDDFKWREFETKIIGKKKLACSTLFAISALQEKCHYINFTPNSDIEINPIQQLALSKKVCFAGKDGKTGETLIKSALAPLFEIRKLNVLSWLSYNFLGNSDGKNLADPKKKRTKIVSKNEYLSKSLPSSVDLYTKTEIDFVPSFGDWKTSVNFIHFKGMLNTEMTMQFTWQGCDTILALPLVIDLVRFTDYFSRVKRSGYLSELNLYFKSTLNSPENLVNQYNNLLNSIQHGKSELA